MSGESTESPTLLAITPKALFLLNQDEFHTVKLAIPLKEVVAKINDSSVVASSVNYVGISFTLKQEILQHDGLTEQFTSNLNMRQFFDSFDAASMSTQVEEIRHELGESILYVKLPTMDAQLFIMFFEIFASTNL